MGVITHIGAVAAGVLITLALQKEFIKEQHKTDKLLLKCLKILTELKTRHDIKQDIRSNVLALYEDLMKWKHGDDYENM